MEAVALALIATAEGAGAGILLCGPTDQAQRRKMCAQRTVKVGRHKNLQLVVANKTAPWLFHEAVLFAVG
jgi:hypothetical protein